MDESLILAAMMQSRECYETFEQYGYGEGLGPVSRIIARFVGEYYGHDNAVQQCDAQVIAARADRDLPNPKHAAAVKAALSSLPTSVSTRNFIVDVRRHRKTAIGDKLSLAIANRVPQDDIDLLVQEYVGVEEGRDAGLDVLGLYDISSNELVDRGSGLIRLWPKQLNDRCDGGALPGHHLLVFARPESGKTLFCLNLVAGFLHQKKSVLYIGNEEPVTQVRDRLHARLLKLPKRALPSPQAVIDRLRAADIGEFQVTDTRSFAHLKRLVKMHRPDILVIDQIRNMHVSKDGLTQQLEASAMQARALGKEHNMLVVSVTQAGDSATDKVYLDMNDVDSSKTGIPAAVDLMLGVGSSKAMRESGFIGLSLPKNKLSGIHENFTCKVDSATGVIE